MSVAAWPSLAIDSPSIANHHTTDLQQPHTQGGGLSVGVRGVLQVHPS